jgi:sugar lactone lactonase YvrE
MTSHARLPRAVFVAFVIAAGFVTIELIAEDVCNNPLACFEPGQEAEMWQALTPFGETNDQQCTNSLHPNPSRVRDDSRQCPRNGFAGLWPPPLGQMLDPFGLAADGERIYVSDQSNHRIQVFKFDGTPIPIAHPIGDGVAGFGPYPEYAAYPALTGTNDPVTGQRLSSPDGIAVDAEHKLIVGDYSGYVMAFNPDGSPAFGTMENPERLQLQAPNGLETKASGIAISSGTIVRGFGVPTQPGDTGRIVISDRLNCFVYIYDAGFNLVRRLPDQIPDDAYQGACVFDEPGNSMFGVFDTPVAAAFDAQGRIFISEYGNNRIQILDANGDSLGGFGHDQLQYPWGVFVDQRGRVVVADTENQRIAFFNVDLSGPPDALLVFELDAKGTLNGFPTAIVEQVGSAAGLDPAGRILVTDTLNNRIQRFQLPDLAIINAAIDRDAHTGTFQVVVPPGKAAAVNNVGVSAAGVNAMVLTLNGVAPANSTPLDVTRTALENATDALGTDIQPSQIATYQFTFGGESEGEISFVFNAVGNGGASSAPAQEANVASPCVDCISTHTIFEKPASPPAITPATPTNSWYNKPLTVRIQASTTDPDGLAAIAFRFLTGPESSGLRWGGGLHTVDAMGSPSLSTDIDVLSEGVSSFRYWAIGADGTVESSHLVTL